MQVLPIPPDHEHDIEERAYLQDEIKELIHHGQLDRFFQDQREQHDALGAFSNLLEPPPRSKEPVDHPALGKVNTIIGRLVEGDVLDKR